MKIYVRDMPEGTSAKHISAVLNPAEHKIAERFSGPIELDVRSSRFGRNVDVYLEIKAEGRFQCDRCLKTFNREVTEKAHLFFRVSEPGEVQDFQEEDDVFVIREDERDFDLAPIVAEYLSLSIPIKTLCDVNCKGLCPVCGADLNVEQCTCSREITDPRWEGLKKFIQ